MVEDKRVPSQNQQFLEKPLPSSEESERVILGSVLIDNDAMPQAAETLLPEDFYSPLNKRVFAAMLALFARASPIDPILIGEEIKKDGVLEAIGGVGAITNLTHGIPYFQNLDEYIKVVADKSSERQLIRACNKIVADVLDGATDTATLKDAAEQAIFEVCEQTTTKAKPQVLGELAHHSLAEKARLMKEGVTFSGIPSGLVDLDKDMGGWKPPDLVIVAGRPSMGKTALCTQFALRAATDDRVVLFCSLEMSKEQLISRILCTEARVNLWRYNNAYIHDGEWTRLNEAYSFELEKRRFFIDDEPAISPMKMLAKARRIYAEQKRLDLIVVDYLQLMSGSTRGESRQQEVSQISRELKAVAKQLNVPVMAVSQLSRAPEGRNPPRPIMSDLRESGSIEQDADAVIFVYREEYYKKTDENAGLAEIIIGKQRNGPTTTVKTTWLGEYTRFEDLYKG